MQNDPATAAERIAGLSSGQIALLNAILDTFRRPIAAWRLEDSDVISVEFLEAFGDLLKLHHTMSDDYLDKHRFESAMERVYKALGGNAHRPARNHPGHDITVDGIPWSPAFVCLYALPLGCAPVGLNLQADGRGDWFAATDHASLPLVAEGPPGAPSVVMWDYLLCWQLGKQFAGTDANLGPLGDFAMKTPSYASLPTFDPGDKKF